MKETVYIETSVVSYYTSRLNRDLIIAARQAITKEKWSKILKNFNTYISALVLQEAEEGDPKAAKERLSAVANLPVLSINDEAEKLASTLVNEGGIPENFPEDALHIAIATVNGIDYLLTWNFTHINNAQMKSKIISIIEKNGYKCPILCSLEELLGEE